MRPGAILKSHRQRRTRRLFCFPPGGAGAGVYRKWMPLFGPEVEVCPLEFPGRLARRQEGLLASLPELVEAAVRCGKLDVATDAADRLVQRTQAAGTNLALGLAARVGALVREGDARQLGA